MENEETGEAFSEVQVALDRGVSLLLTIDYIPNIYYIYIIYTLSLQRPFFSAFLFLV